MFSSVEWAKRWLPAVFLLLSLFLPWWTMIDLSVESSLHRAETYHFRPFESFRLSFPWADILDFSFWSSFTSPSISYFVAFSNIPFLCFVSGLALLGGLCGLSNDRGTRTLGGLLGTGSVVFYFVRQLVFPPLELPGIFYFGIGEYYTGGLHRFQLSAVWFLSVGFCLAAIGSLMLLAPPVRTPMSLVSVVRTGLERSKELIVLGIGRVKRQLPAVFLLASLFIPWSMIIEVSNPNVETYYGSVGRGFQVFHNIALSFPWEESMRFYIGSAELQTNWAVEFSLIPYFVFVSALIVVAGLCGLSSRDETRTLGGLLGIMGVISYSILILPKFVPSVVLKQVENPFFGTYLPEEVATDMFTWFISPGFFLATIGSLMLLLLPPIKTLIEILRKPVAPTA